MQSPERRELERQDRLVSRISEICLMVLGVLGATFGMWLLVTHADKTTALFVTFGSAFIMLTTVLRVFVEDARSLRFRLADAHETMTWLQVCGMADPHGVDRRCLHPVGHAGGHEFGSLAALLSARTGGSAEATTLPGEAHHGVASG